MYEVCYDVSILLITFMKRLLSLVTLIILVGAGCANNSLLVKNEPETVVKTEEKKVVNPEPKSITSTSKQETPSKPAMVIKECGRVGKCLLEAIKTCSLAKGSLSLYEATNPNATYANTAERLLKQIAFPEQKYEIKGYKDGECILMLQSITEISGGISTIVQEYKHRDTSKMAIDFAYLGGEKINLSISDNVMKNGTVIVEISNKTTIKQSSCGSTDKECFSKAAVNNCAPASLYINNPDLKVSYSIMIEKKVADFCVLAIERKGSDNQNGSITCVTKKDLVKTVTDEILTDGDSAILDKFTSQGIFACAAR